MSEELYHTFRRRKRRQIVFVQLSYIAYILAVWPVRVVVSQLITWKLDSLETLKMYCMMRVSVPSRHNFYNYQHYLVIWVAL